jgi:hypothetical protein
VPFVFNDPQHWFDRAAEARELAAKMTDLGARGDMLIIADEYEKIGQRAAKRRAAIEAEESKAKLP